MKPLVPHVVAFAQRAIGWLSALRDSRRLAQTREQRAARAERKDRIAARKRPTRAEIEDTLFAVAMARLSTMQKGP